MTFNELAELKTKGLVQVVAVHDLGGVDVEMEIVYLKPEEQPTLLVPSQNQRKPIRKAAGQLRFLD